MRSSARRAYLKKERRRKKKDNQASVWNYLAMAFTAGGIACLAGTILKSAALHGEAGTGIAVAGWIGLIIAAGGGIFSAMTALGALDGRRDKTGILAGVVFVLFCLLFITGTH